VYKKIRIKNFKSLRDVNLELHKVNVVVGPNGSGKSNLVDAFLFLKEITQYGLEKALSLFDGFDNVVFMNNIYDKISFEIEGENPKLYYYLELSSSHIDKEIVNFKGVYVERSDNLVSLDGLKFEIQSNKSIASFLINPISDLLVLRIDAEKALLPSPEGYNTIDYDGFGLPSILLKSFPKAVASFLKENNLDIKVIKEGGKVFLHFEKIVGDKRVKVSRPSAGVVKTLVILTAIYSLKPSLIVIDEVENSLHLNFVEMLTDFFEFSDPQFLVTTHSPLVIDLTNPSDIILLHWVNGETIVKRINDDKIDEKLAERGVTLSEWLFYAPREGMFNY